MTTMRAKLKVTGIQSFGSESERLQFGAVCANQYPADGSDENNTFAKFTPTADLSMVVNNPALVGQFKLGDVFYVDFTPAPK